MSDSSPQPIPAARAEPARRATIKLQPVTIGLAIALGLIGLLWYHTNAELNRVRDDVARRVQQSDLELRENRLMAREAQEFSRESQSRLGVLEGRLNESQNQQVALEQLYSELSRGRDEWLIAEVEQTIALASQQLQLAGNVQGALLALQIADARLARADRPQHIPLRKVLNRDIDRLKALPAIDIAGLTLKIDALIGGTDQLALLSDGRPQVDAEDASAGSPMWTRLSALVWGEIKQLVRIQRLDSSDQGLLTPEQSYFLRENFKLRLMHSRIALLQRNETLFREDVKAAQQWLARYFDTRQTRVKVATETLDQLNNANLNIQLPTLADSLAAARTLKLSGDKTN